MITIGPYTLSSQVVLAPMAGVSDLPFRRLCRQHGAALAASEMVSANLALWDSEKSRLRRRQDAESTPRVVQIAGSDPAMMAAAAQANVDDGAQIIDINMGCPAKKVLKRAAGSALMKDEALVRDILGAVVQAVAVPVTLKMRTGWDPEHRNGPTIARIAEDLGIQALAVHGRTRACLYRGQAEYDTIARICESVKLPVFANGDIDSPEKARQVLDHTGAAGVMIGRGAQGRPWIFREIDHFLRHGRHLTPPSRQEISHLLFSHVAALHGFYGEFKGVLIARKHVGWYLQTLPDAHAWRRQFNALDSAPAQLACLSEFFSMHERHNNNREQPEPLSAGALPARQATGKEIAA